MAKHIVIDKIIVPFIVSLALFMDALDATIINTAIPAIAHSLGVYPVDLKIALISYLVSLAIFIPVSGWLADKYGVKRVFVLALGIFTLSSLGCGYAQSLGQLVVARAFQGLGGALMLPLGRLILLRTFERHEMVNVMNQVVVVVSFGLMFGPVAGGVITDHFSWHWIFWVNLPVGLLAIISALLFIHDKTPKKPRPFDKLGFVLFGGGLSSLIFAFSDLSESSTNQKLALTIMGAAIILLLAYLLHARRQRHPIVNLKLLKIRTLQISMTGNLICRLGFGSVPFLLPLLFQISLNYSAEVSGLLILPIALGILMTKCFVLKILRVVGYKKLLLLNTLLVGTSLWSFKIIVGSTSFWVIALLTFLFGTLISMQYSAMNSLGYSDVSADDLSSVTSLVSTVQQTSQSFGVAIGALLLRYFSHDTHQASMLTPDVFHQVFFILGIITLLTAFLFLRLKPHDGHQMLNAPMQKKIAAS